MPIINFTLFKDDFLQHQLYVLSKNKRLKKQYLKNKINFTIIIFTIGCLFYLRDDEIIGLGFIGAGALFFIFYSLIEKDTYLKHYTNFINDAYANYDEERVTISFYDDKIKIIDNWTETCINLTQITEVAETQMYFYLKLKQNGSHIIIPKLRIKNLNELTGVIEKIAHTNQLTINKDLDWKW